MFLPTSPLNVPQSSDLPYGCVKYETQKQKTLPLIWMEMKGTPQRQLHGKTPEIITDFNSAVLGNLKLPSL